MYADGFDAESLKIQCGTEQQEENISPEDRITINGDKRFTEITCLCVMLFLFNMFIIRIDRLYL